MISPRNCACRVPGPRACCKSRDAGLVKITVAEMPGLHTELENRLEQKYGLLDVLAVDVAAAGSSKNLAGESGADGYGYLRKHGP